MANRPKLATKAPAVASTAPAGAKAPPATYTPERRLLRALVPNPRNSRSHPEVQIAQIRASMREFGWTTPILIDEADVILAGHGRREAGLLEGLGETEVAVTVARGLSDAQKRAYLIADNKIAENAGWDLPTLRLELGELGLLDFDVSLIGFSAPELASIEASGLVPKTDPEDAPEPPAVPTSRLGDLWIMGGHRVLCGDSTAAADVDRLLAGTKPPLMVTDPPYGVNYDPAWRDAMGIDWTGAVQRKSTHAGLKPLKSRSLGKVVNDDRADWTPAWRLFPGAAVYIWHGGLHAAEVQVSIENAGFAIRAQIIWAKQHFVFSRGDYHWQHEPCWYAVRKGSKWRGDRKQSTLWAIANASSFHGEKDDAHTGHGTQKPVECMKRPMLDNSQPGEGVYDPFVGSGTTVIAAEMTGRKCFGMEISPAYVDVVVLRWQSFTGRTAVLEGDGRTFAEVAAERAAAQPAVTTPAASSASRSSRSAKSTGTASSSTTPEPPQSVQAIHDVSGEPSSRS